MDLWPAMRPCIDHSLRSTVEGEAEVAKKNRSVDIIVCGIGALADNSMSSCNGTATLWMTGISTRKSRRRLTKPTNGSFSREGAARLK